MIPAILSVVFVVYLYQSLQAETGASVTGGPGIGSQEMDQAARLEVLRARVERLTHGRPQQEEQR
jgi:hypothetical protein